MKYYRSKNQRYLPIYTINKQINPGQVLAIPDEQAILAKTAIDSLLAHGDIEEVDDTAGPIVLPPIKKPNANGGAILPEHVTVSSEKTIKVSRPFADETDSDAGSVLVPGQFPGDGKIITVEEAVKTQLEEAKKATEAITAEFQKLTPKPPEQKVEYPTDLQNWFSLRHAQKKTEILYTSDITRLNYIAEWDKNAKVQKVISQRLKELEPEKGATNGKESKL